MSTNTPDTVTRPQRFDSRGGTNPLLGSGIVSVRRWLGGIGFTFVVALLGLGASKLPLLDRVGQLACAILIAVLYRQVAGYPQQLRSGIQFAAKRLLRFAIILYGLKLNIDVILHQACSWPGCGTRLSAPRRRPMTAGAKRRLNFPGFCLALSP
ncbi:putative sulfate exporter family transporter [Alicyclobacillus herbarius]|uniref:putative sulfate exporter family transporter n=1 Tax=Alicyclobacillus herbarius TaxID=122960 RepID=UPI002356682D|nr:putative sulfate exporter family transporter [Alicyclobacillus herbarius]